MKNNKIGSFLFIIKELYYKQLYTSIYKGIIFFVYITDAANPVFEEGGAAD